MAILAVGSGTARFFALQAGSVDAAMLSIPANLMAQEAGFRELVSFIEQEWIELQGTVNVTEQLLASDPGLVEKFVRATLKGFIHFRDQRARTVEILMRFLRTKEDAVNEDLRLDAAQFDSRRNRQRRDPTQIAGARGRSRRSQGAAAA